MDEVWELLGDMLEVQVDYVLHHPVMDNAVLQLTDFQREVGGKYGADWGQGGGADSAHLPIAHITFVGIEHSHRLEVALSLCIYKYVYSVCRFAAVSDGTLNLFMCW